jgi:3-oxoadipate enol-lactonase
MTTVAPTIAKEANSMPNVTTNNITMNYEQQGTGEPLILILIPYLAADNACYAFQVAEYAKHFTCVCVDLSGTGGSDNAESAYTTELLADDIAAFMQAAGIAKAHVAGLSLGAAVGMWVAAKYPDRVRSLSVYSGWPKTDAFLRTVVESWQIVAKAVGVAEMTVRAIFPWCFTPELYTGRPDYIDSLAAFVRSRRPQSMPNFIPQSTAVLAHDVEAHLGRIIAPTQITFGRHDQLTPSAPSRIALKLPHPRYRLRMISGVHRSAKISAPRAMGQYCPYVLTTPVLRTRLRL